MTRLAINTFVVAAVLIAGRAAVRAEPGYCDHVIGVADAESALLMSPQLFGSVGLIDQAAIVDTPDGASSDLRATLGVRYRLNGIYDGVLTRRRARAECRRHRAEGRVRTDPEYRALEARARVLEEALSEAEATLDRAEKDRAGHRTTAQEAIATQLRVDQLRALAAATRTRLDALPAPASGEPSSGALAAYYQADAEVEEQEARLRRSRAWDVNLRAGYDSYLGAAGESPFFAVLSVGINVGWLFQDGSNERAAAGRVRMVREERADARLERLRSVLETERERAQQSGLLVAELEQQLEQLRQIGGDTGRRLASTVWFEWVEARAEHAYLTAHVANLDDVLRGDEDK